MERKTLQTLRRVVEKRINDLWEIADNYDYIEAVRDKARDELSELAEARDILQREISQPFL